MMVLLILITPLNLKKNNLENIIFQNNYIDTTGISLIEKYTISETTYDEISKRLAPKEMLQLFGIISLEMAGDDTFPIDGFARNIIELNANQEVSYLLQRIETHPGLVILASNFKDNIDDAFTRRFQSLVPFELPGAKERKQIWEKNLPQQITISQDVDMDSIAKKYELSGSNIVNIIHYCSLKVLSLQSEILTNEILIEGIKKEYLKEDRLF